MQSQPKRTSSDLSLEGLDGLLGNRDVESVQDWTVEETARAFGLSRGGVIRRLEDGVLSGYKVKRAGGYVWRVRPLWLDPLETNENGSDNAEAQADDEDEEDCALNDSLEHVEFAEIVDESDFSFSTQAEASQELISLRACLEKAEIQYVETARRLESATYRIGYLDAQIASYVEQLKLLTADKGYLPRWCRWRSWFISAREE